jgi:cytosine/creatinine deaminase
VKQADPASGEAFVLRGLLAPRTFCDLPGESELARVDVGISGDMIDFVAPAEARTPAAGREIHLERTMVWPCFAEAHCHLDSSQIWTRSPNPDGTFESAARAIVADREHHWSADDMERRMRFGLACAYGYGVRAMRTHLASQNDQVEQRWEIFAGLRDEWAGRIALQAVPLISTDALADPETLGRIARLVVSHGGVLGAFAPLAAHLDERLDALFAIADRHGLMLDFHADETGNAASDVLRRIAVAAKRHGGAIPVTVGHCCSLANQDEAQIDATLDLVASANITVVSLPSCNLYLQDRVAGRTPRWRGVTLLHEMALRGIPVCIGSDNCRDPYHPYGDFNLLEMFRDAVRIGHLDHPIGDWPRAVTTTPGGLFGLPQRLSAGMPADLVLYRAASLNELLTRPWTERRLIRRGTFVDAAVPDFAEVEA